jgi:DHA1 family bicyclomycin/chloramphenicol resistance-like MFS transporter
MTQEAARPSFAILVAISTIGPLALNIFMPSLPGLQKEFGVTYGTVQLTLTLYLLGTALCQLVYGPLSDRIGRRPPLLAGLALFVAASVLAAFAWNIEALIFARLVQAVGGSAGIVLARAMVRDVYDREKSASVIAYITMAFVVAPMIAPVVGGVLDQYAGWQASFWLLGALGGAILASAWKILPETRQGSSGNPVGFFAGATTLLGIKRFRGYALSLAFSSGVFFAFLGGAPHVMIDVLGRTPLEYGIWFAAVSLGYMMGNYVSGRFTQRLGIDRLILIGAFVTVTGGVLCFVAAMTGLLSPLTLFGPMVFAAFGNGLTIPNATAGAISVDPRLTGAAAGWSGFTQMTFGAFVSQLVGSLQDSWPLAVFWCMAILSLLALATHVIATRRR